MIMMMMMIIIIIIISGLSPGRPKIPISRLQNSSAK